MGAGSTYRRSRPLCLIIATEAGGGGASPGVSVVKKPPANPGDLGSIPDPGRSHMPQIN